MSFLGAAPARSGKAERCEESSAADQRRAQEVSTRIDRDFFECFSESTVAVERAEGQVVHRWSPFTKPVRASAVMTARLDRGSSVGPVAGSLPAIARIHAACRASTETISAAGTSALAVRFVAWPLYAATPRSSSSAGQSMQPGPGGLAWHPKWLMLPLSKGAVRACLTCGWAAFGDLEKRTGFNSSNSSCWLAALCLPRRTAHSQPANVLRRPRRATGPRSSGPSTRSTPRVRMSELEGSTRRAPSTRSLPRVRRSKLERHAHRAQTQALGRGQAPARVRSHGRFWERSLLLLLLPPPPR